MIATIIVIIIILIPALLGVRSLIRVFNGTERCECPGDCSHCQIKCRSNQNYYGIQKSGEEKYNDTGRT